MNDKVILVTPPDDVLYDGYRILLVDLNDDQQYIVSEALRQVDIPNTIVYMYVNQNVNWMVDKKHKSSIIVFNAESNDQATVGYLVAQPNSYYFGTLRDFSKVNDRSINSIEQLIDILENTV